MQDSEMADKEQEQQLQQESVQEESPKEEKVEEKVEEPLVPKDSILTKMDEAMHVSEKKNLVKPLHLMQISYN